MIAVKVRILKFVFPYFPVLSIDSSCKDPDWLYVRTASMVRKIYIRKGMGVGDLAHQRHVVTFC